MLLYNIVSLLEGIPKMNVLFANKPFNRFCQNHFEDWKKDYKDIVRYGRG